MNYFSWEVGVGQCVPSMLYEVVCKTERGENCSVLDGLSVQRLIVSY